MLLPDQTYEQANNSNNQLQHQQHQQHQKHHQDYLRRSYDEFNRIIDLKEIDVKRLQRNIFDSGVVAEGEEVPEGRPEGRRIPQQRTAPVDDFVVLTNNEMKFCQASRGSGGGSSGVPDTASGGGGSGQRSPRGSGGAGSGTKEDTDSAIWSSAREQCAKRAGNNGTPNDSRTPTRSSSSRSPGEEGWKGRRSSTAVGSWHQRRKAHQRARGRRRPASSCSSDYSSDGDLQTDLGSGSSLEEDEEYGEEFEEPKLDDYDKTSDFFNNIPEFHGETLGPFSLQSQKNELSNIRTNIDILRACELFLMRNRIRPDFFCKYKKVVNASVSAPPSFPLSGSARTPVDNSPAGRKPKSVSPSTLRRPPPPAPAPDRRSLSQHQPATHPLPPPPPPPGVRQTSPPPPPPPVAVTSTKDGPTVPIYSVPNRAGKRRRFIATVNTGK